MRQTGLCLMWQAPAAVFWQVLLLLTLLLTQSKRADGANSVLLIDEPDAQPEPLIRSEQLFAPARILPSTMERVHDRNHGRYVAIRLTEGAALINAAQEGSRAAQEVRATLEQLVRPSAAAELPGQTPSARSSNQDLKPIKGRSGPDLY